MQSIEMIRSQNHHRHDVIELIEAYEKLRDGICLDVIPGTVIACGEGSNYCSRMCEMRNEHRAASE